MGNRVLVIAETETFTVRGLIMKMNGRGMAASYGAPEAKELEEGCPETDLFVLYADEGIVVKKEALNYLKSYCMAQSKPLLLIGSREDEMMLDGFLPDVCLRARFDRPVDMEEFLNCAERELSEEAAGIQRKRILVVDDDPAYLQLIFDWLKDSYQVFMVNSGMKAITWLAKNQTDLILLDYEMPVTSGPKVLEMIRSETETSKIPVIFLTGNNEKESIMKVLALKPADYLLKTIKKEELQRKLEEFFRSGKTKTT